MERIVVILFWLTTILLTPKLAAQIPATNLSRQNINFDIPSQAARKVVAYQNQSIKDSSTNGSKLLPLVEFHDVPIATAIENLCRQAEINYLLDPELEKAWADSPEPSVGFTKRNISAREVLLQLLNEHHLALKEDPFSNIAYVIPANQNSNNLFDGESWIETNSYSRHTNVIPLIQFSEVPITTAIENLVRQEAINYVINPRVSEPWRDSGPGHIPEPVLNYRLENVTCWGALNRTLNLHGMTLIEDPATGVAEITLPGQQRNKVNLRLLNMESNTIPIYANGAIPLIQFEDVPLDVALKNLATQSALKIKLDPRLTQLADPANRWFNPMPQLSIRWEGITATQALAAVCNYFDLTIVKNTDGELEIKPREAKHHHHIRFRSSR